MVYYTKVISLLIFPLWPILYYFIICIQRQNAQISVFSFLIHSISSGFKHLLGFWFCTELSKFSLYPVITQGSPQTLYPSQVQTNTWDSKYLATAKAVLFLWCSHSVRTSYFVVSSFISVLLGFGFIENCYEGGQSKVPREWVACG